MNKVWFITGASSGFGLEFTKATLKQGDKVMGCARHIELLEKLQDEYSKPFSSDVSI